MSRWPLHSACSVGDLDLAQWLVSQGAAAVDACANDGEQPLYAACSAGHLRIAQWLVSQGAAADARDNDGFQPLHTASLLAIWRWHSG